MWKLILKKKLIYILWVIGRKLKILELADLFSNGAKRRLQRNRPSHMLSFGKTNYLFNGYTFTGHLALEKSV